MMGVLLYLLGMLAVLASVVAVVLPLESFVAWKLWGWFVVPLGVPLPSIWVMVGLVLIVRLMSNRRSQTRSEEKIGALLAGAVVGPAFFLLLGWIAHCLAR